MTLSNWIRDYIYIPLGCSKISASRTYVNVLISMSISGLWHGASFNFVLWGFLNGLILAIERFLNATTSINPLRLFLNLLVVFHLWVVFRVESFSDLPIFFKKMYTIQIFEEPLYILLSILCAVIAVISQTIDEKEIWRAKIDKWNGTVLYSVCISVIFFSLVVSSGTSAKFIYFDF